MLHKLASDASALYTEQWLTDLSVGHELDDGRLYAQAGLGVPILGYYRAHLSRYWHDLRHVGFQGDRSDRLRFRELIYSGIERGYESHADWKRARLFGALRQAAWPAVPPECLADRLENDRSRRMADRMRRISRGGPATLVCGMFHEYEVAALLEGHYEGTAKHLVRYRSLSRSPRTAKQLSGRLAQALGDLND